MIRIAFAAVESVTLESAAGFFHRFKERCRTQRIVPREEANASAVLYA
jgi:hypothetical protein